MRLNIKEAFSMVNWATYKNDISGLTLDDARIIQSIHDSLNREEQIYLEERTRYFELLDKFRDYIVI